MFYTSQPKSHKNFRLQEKPVEYVIENRLTGEQTDIYLSKIEAKVALVNSNFDQAVYAVVPAR
jgi:hypothetical protein